MDPSAARHFIPRRLIETSLRDAEATHVIRSLNDCSDGPAMNFRRSALRGLVLLLAACAREARDLPDTSTTAVSLRAVTTQRSAFQVVGSDTLSDSARVLEIHPEQDGDALVTLFTDPGRRVSSGLAIVDRKMAAPQLIWPDSVTTVWWTGSHTLAFSTNTGTGIRLVVDVHAPELHVADTNATILTRPASEIPVDSGMMQRARTYTDSVRGQIGGTPQTSALAYTVTRLVKSPDGRLGAFHTTARDAGGRTTNPAWYVLDRESGAVTLIDQITGPATELPGTAGQWSQVGSFFYAKGRALWEAEISREAAGGGSPRS